jgi:geranylgeranyl diphosphate synthase type I
LDRVSDPTAKPPASTRPIPRAGPWFDPADVSRLVATTARETVATALTAFPGADATLPLAARLMPDGLDLLTTAFTEAADGGKHLRAHLAFTAWGTFGGAGDGTDGTASSTGALDYPHMTHLAAALELFQVSALIHDDIVDGADTRRARPSSHRHLEAALRRRFAVPHAERLGRDLAILLGDLALVASERQAHLAIRDAAPATAAAIAEALDTMRAQVMIGQFLDTMAPTTPLQPYEAALRDAVGIALVKAAHYSVTFPLVIGALAADASASDREALIAFATPIGLAYQLRDDILGVFGAERTTGKPADGDLADGKRTVLIALARRNLDPVPAARLAAILAGSPGPAEVAEARQLVRDSGAADDAEHLITRCHHAGLEALDALAGVPLEPLIALADRLVHRAM